MLYSARSRMNIMLVAVIACTVGPARLVAQRDTQSLPAQRQRVRAIVAELLQTVRADTAQLVVTDEERTELSQLLGEIVSHARSPISGPRMRAMQSLIADRYPTLLTSNSDKFLAIVFGPDGTISRHTLAQSGSQRQTVDETLVVLYRDTPLDQYESYGAGSIPVAQNSKRSVTVYYAVRR